MVLTSSGRSFILLPGSGAAAQIPGAAAIGRTVSVPSITPTAENETPSTEATDEHDAVLLSGLVNFGWVVYDLVQSH